MLWRVDESIWFHVKHPTARSSPDQALGFDGKPAQIQTSGSALNNPTDRSCCIGVLTSNEHPRAGRARISKAGPHKTSDVPLAKNPSIPSGWNLQRPPAARTSCPVCRGAAARSNHPVLRGASHGPLQPRSKHSVSTESQTSRSALKNPTDRPAVSEHLLPTNIQGPAGRGSARRVHMKRPTPLSPKIRASRPGGPPTPPAARTSGPCAAAPPQDPGTLFHVEHPTDRSDQIHSQLVCHGRQKSNIRVHLEHRADKQRFYT